MMQLRVQMLTPESARCSWKRRISSSVAVSGSRPYADYHDRFGYRQERFSSSRHRCGREDGHQEAASSQQGGSVFRSAAAMPGWDGSLCVGALLGTRVEEAWSPGPFDAGEG